MLLETDRISIASRYSPWAHSRPGKPSATRASRRDPTALTVPAMKADRSPKRLVWRPIQGPVRTPTRPDRPATREAKVGLKPTFRAASTITAVSAP
ncbi:hypothetical protein ASQ49_04905 [Acidipropionibacterium acidipropionici]|nr:hypothetical protein ASQ49_04905 [Acidipropionibacterium acidipropionici]APZ09517.1 hypothetical protein BWX38_10020 [Acidipropionibacterium acidipropionici]